MKIQMENKVAVITGGSRGIGQATAILFAEAGADIAITYRSNESAAIKVQQEIEKLGRKCIIIQAELSKVTDANNIVEIAMNELGRIDYLILNHGIWENNPIDSMTDENLAKTIDTNLNGCFYLTRAAVPHMKKNGSGSIVYISSTAGQRGEAFYSPYAASKGALISLTKSLAAELAPDNIRVNCVAPGWVITDMSKDALKKDTGGKITEKILVKRAGAPKEIAAPVLFIASEEASFITGEILNVNGGAVLCG